MPYKQRKTLVPCWGGLWRRWETDTRYTKTLQV